MIIYFALGLGRVSPSQLRTVSAGADGLKDGCSDLARWPPGFLTPWQPDSKSEHPKGMRQKDLVFL